MAILLTWTKSIVSSNITHYQKLIEKISALCYHRTFAQSEPNINSKITYVIVSKTVEFKKITFLSCNVHLECSTHSAGLLKTDDWSGWCICTIYCLYLLGHLFPIISSYWVMRNWPYCQQPHWLQISCFSIAIVNLALPQIILIHLSP